MHSLLTSRTHFSLGESTLTPKQLVSEALKVSAKSVGVCDVMSVNSLVEMTRECEGAGLKFILGVRIRLVDDYSWRKTKEGGAKAPPEYYGILYTLSDAGLSSIYRLLTLGFSDARFYNVPKLGFDDLYAELEKVGRDDLVFATGDSNGILHHPQYADIIQRINTRVDVYAQLVPINTPLYDKLNKLAIDVAQAQDLKLITTYPTLYEEGGADTHEILGAICNNNKLSDGWHRSHYIRDFHPHNEADLRQKSNATFYRMIVRYELEGAKYLPLFEASMKNTQELEERVKYEWKKQEPSLPKIADDEHAKLVELCKAGWRKRFANPVLAHQPTASELRELYLPRLRYELSTLRNLRFSGYFLLVQDTVSAAKLAGIAVGPGRGSVGGSLVAYLCEITDVDPIRFNLLFERFINPERNDLPDADLDFESSRREEVVDYLVHKYGSDRVAGIVNYGTLGSSSAIRDVSRVCGLPEDEYACSKLVPKVHGKSIALKELVDVKSPHYVKEIHEFERKYDLVWGHAVRLDGVLRNYGRHAAGCVVSGCDLVDRAVVERRKGSGVVNWDKDLAEAQGLVKMDLLGLETLDIMELAKRYVSKRHGLNIDLLSIDLLDGSTLSAFSRGETCGVFQFSSGGMRRLLRDLAKSGSLTFEDLVAATALYRPGPMDSGMMQQYINRKLGREVVEYDHPAIEKALSSTYGVMVYQEQTQRIAQDLAGFTGAQADKLRRAIGKKKADEMAVWKDKFIEGAQLNGMSKEIAEEWWANTETNAGYQFNRSHSVEYAIISFQQMWLKVHYPIETLAACLSLVKQDDLPALINDAKKLGIKVVPPDINQATNEFLIIDDHTLMIPFNRVKNISDITTNAILKAREAGLFLNQEDFFNRVERKKCNVRHRSILDKIGSFCSIDLSLHGVADPSRARDQLDFLPGLVSDAVPVDRYMVVDNSAKAGLNKVITSVRDRGKKHPRPKLGKSPSFMVVFDAPTKAEIEDDQITAGGSFGYLARALSQAGFTKEDAYWTTLCKGEKKGKQLSPGQIAEFSDYLTQEIEVLKPPLIVLMGGAASRHFVKDIRGNTAEQAGRIVYDKSTDTNYMIGFNPQSIHFDPDKQVILEEMFQKIAELV